MALSFHPTTAPLFGHHHLPAADDMGCFLLHDPELTDALLGFVYDPLDPADAALDDLLNLPPRDDDGAILLTPLNDSSDGEVVQQRRAKKQRACGDAAWRRGLAADIDAAAAGKLCNGGGNQQAPAAALPELLNEFVLPALPLAPPQLPAEPVAFVRAADAKKAAGNNVSQSVQSAAARQRRKRISEKTAELSRLIPGGHKMNTAEMLEAAARHVKLLQAQVGMLALMRTVAVGSTENEKMPSMAQEHMAKLLVRGDVQERLAAEGKCLVPRKLVDAVAKDSSVMASALVNRDLGRFVASLPAGQ